MSTADPRSKLETAIQAGIDAAQKELHTSMPGEVISFDPVEQTADIQLTIKRKQDGQLVNIPVLKGVPVRFLAVSGFTITLPVKAGDNVLVIFSERSIDTWLADGGIKDPADIRKHSLSDAFAFPMMYAQPGKIGSFDPDNLQIKSRNGQTTITLDDAGQVTITGDVSVTGDVIADGISLKNHTHPQGPDSDGDAQQNTGAPL